MIPSPHGNKQTKTKTKQQRITTFPTTRQQTNQNQITNPKPTTTNQFSAPQNPIPLPSPQNQIKSHPRQPKTKSFFYSFFTDKPKPTTKPYQFFTLETHSTPQSNPQHKPQGSQNHDTDHQMEIEFGEWRSWCGRFLRVIAIIFAKYMVYLIYCECSRVLYLEQDKVQWPKPKTLQEEQRE